MDSDKPSTSQGLEGAEFTHLRLVPYPSSDSETDSDSGDPYQTTLTGEFFKTNLPMNLFFKNFKYS